MWLRIASRFPAVQVISPCWWYRPHAGQMSRRASRMVENYEKVLTKFFAEHPEHASLRRLAWSYLYLDGAWSFLDEGDERTARALMWKSVFRALGLSETNGFESFLGRESLQGWCWAKNCFGKFRESYRLIVSDVGAGGAPGLAATTPPA